MAGPQRLAELLDQIASAAQTRDRISVADLRDLLGDRSFAPFLLIPAVLPFTPLASIPFVPSVMATFVILIAAQRLAGSERVWLPKALLRRSLERRLTLRLLSYARPAAKMFDHLASPRLSVLTSEPAVRLMGLLCIVAAAAAIVLELIPFIGATAWTAIGLFGLSLMSRDGVLAMLAFSYSGGALWLLYASLV